MSLSASGVPDSKRQQERREEERGLLSARGVRGGKRQQEKEVRHGRRRTGAGYCQQEVFVGDKR